MTSELDILHERLRLAEQRAEEEQQRADKEQQRADNEQQRAEEEQQRREIEQNRREEAEQKIEQNNLFGLLNGCHKLSLAIKPETDAALTTQGDATNPVNRIYPKRIVPWIEFPDLQESVWNALCKESDFVSRRLFASQHQLDLIRQDVTSISSEIDPRFFRRDTTDRFTRAILNELGENETLRRRFKIKGRVAFESHANMNSRSEVSLEDTVEQLHIREHFSQQSSRETTTRQPKRRRNRRADQFCVHVIAEEHRTPVYVVEFKAPHKLSLQELVVGLHKMDLDRDVINKDGDDFEYYATRLVAAVITQCFSYMVDMGVRKGKLDTGEALVYLYIPDDPSTVQFYLCVPNEDVIDDDEFRLYRTAVAQDLAFTLNALQDDHPSQSWYDAANKLDTWKVEYLDILRDIPESVRKDPPSSEYKPSRWRPSDKVFDRSPYMLRRSCQPNLGTPRRGSDDDEEEEGGHSHSPPTPSPVRGRNSGKRGQRGQGSSHRGNRQIRGASGRESTGRDTWRQYCTMRCLSGLVRGGALDAACPNVHDHGSQKHQLSAREFINRLSTQLSMDREDGFEQLHIRGRTGFLLKATLISHGYTVIVKAANSEHVSNLKHEISTYQRLRCLQGSHIPVCIGGFMPRVPYYYHGEMIAHMMILSWAGIRAHKVITKDKESFFLKQQQELLLRIESCGVKHRDPKWRNVLWNDEINGLLMIDFEEPPRQTSVVRPANQKALKMRRSLETLVGVANPLNESSGNRLRPKWKISGESDTAIKLQTILSSTDGEPATRGSKPRAM